MQQKPASKGDFEAGWRSRCSVDTDNAAPVLLARWAYNNLTADRCRFEKVVPHVRFDSTISRLTVRS